MMVESVAGRLLLAAPTLEDPNFLRTVVLVGVHNEEGAMGVVLNRPSASAVGEAVPQLSDAVGRDATVYVGGPVQPGSIVCLAEFVEPEAAALLVMGRIGFPPPDVVVEDLAQTTSRGRVFAGYAGWGEGQLEGELESGDWIVLDGQPQDVFTDSPDALWSDVLTRNGGRYALIARMPIDPSLN
jgi:putative transcriptional regulator